MTRYLVISKHMRTGLQVGSALSIFITKLAIANFSHKLITSVLRNKGNLSRDSIQTMDLRGAQRERVLSSVVG